MKSESTAACQSTSFERNVLARWIAGGHRTTIVAPAGPTARFAAGVLDQWPDDIAVRIEHAGHDGGPSVDVVAFDNSSESIEVWRRSGHQGDVVVTACSVHHEPVLPAVAYRIDGPTGSVVVSGDTIVCSEVEALAAGADVLVHEVRLRSFAEAVVGTHYEPIPFIEEVRSGGFTGELVAGDDLTTVEW